MENIVQIAGKPLPVREYKGQRVVTINDIAAVHRVKTDNIRMNFSRNKKRFIEGTDYYFLSGRSEVTKCYIPQVTKINVFTESGYLMLVKSMTDDLAWKVQRQLVNLYFRIKTVEKTIHRNRISVGTIAGLGSLLKDEYRKILYYRITKELTQEETAKILGCSTDMVQRFESALRGVGIHIPSQSGKRQFLRIMPTTRMLSVSN